MRTALSRGCLTLSRRVSAFGLIATVAVMVLDGSAPAALIQHPGSAPAA